MPSLSQADRVRTIALGSIGGGLEIYDFVIFALFADALGQIFFPGESAAARLGAVFAVFAAGNLVRPFSGLLFSHFGDRYGRRMMLRISIAGMALATTAMAVLPGYETLGVAAPILFAVIRVLQGFFLGGELPGAMVLITEALPQRRGLACSLLFVAVYGGLLLAQLTHWLLVDLISNQALTHYGWRIAFGIGGLLAVIGYVLRAKLVESPAFADLGQRIQKIPLESLLRQHWRHVLAGLLVISQVGAVAALLYLYMDSYLTDFLHYDRAASARAGVAGVLVFIAVLPLSGWLGDRFGLKWPVLVGSCLLALAAIPLYAWLRSGEEAVLPALALLSLLASLAYGAATGLATALFPAEVRYSGVALVFNIGIAGAGGLTPVVATNWIRASGSTAPPAYLLAGFCLLSALALIRLRVGSGR